MHKTFEYFRSPIISSIRDNVQSYLKFKGIDLAATTADPATRDLLLQHFKTQEFHGNYLALAESVARQLGLDLTDTAVQPVPTPRIFTPSAHGTSYHCDYWYGHGNSFFTVWVPLAGITQGSTFTLVRDAAANTAALTRLSETHPFSLSNMDIDNDLVPAMPSSDECVVFSSMTLHGSPINTSRTTRYSFDFRLGNLSDKTTTKQLDTYYRWQNDTFAPPLQKNVKRCLKYICGGTSITTTAQHILIEGVAANLGLPICGQEAEIERLGNPMLLYHSSSIGNNKQFDAIIVASKHVVPPEILRYLSQQNANIFFAAENEWL